MIISNKYNILDEISNFRKWKEKNYPKRESDIFGEWETNYNGWTEIYTAFEYMLQSKTADEADEFLIDELIYIIARDNECEELIDDLTKYSEWFEILCSRCILSNEPEAKWQFASRLPVCRCDKKVKDYILKFAEDKDEYVSRRALLVMPRLRPDKVEDYAELFWNRKVFNKEQQDYQKMVVLEALKEISSPLLNEYLDKAEQEGGNVLCNYIKDMEYLK